MKGLSRANSLFRKKEEPKVEARQEKEEKKSVTINLTLNLTLDKESMSKAMDMLDLYSDLVDDDSGYKRSVNGDRDYREKDYRDRERDNRNYKFKDTYF